MKVIDAVYAKKYLTDNKKNYDNIVKAGYSNTNTNNVYILYNDEDILDVDDLYGGKKKESIETRFTKVLGYMIQMYNNILPDNNVNTQQFTELLHLFIKNDDVIHKILEKD